MTVEPTPSTETPKSAAATPPATPPAAETPKPTEAETPKPTEAAPAPAKTDSVPPWMISRIDALTRQKKDLETRLAAVQKQVPQQPLPSMPRTTAAAAKSPAQTEEELRRIETRAEELASEKIFSNRCNELYEQGKSEFNDFDATMETYRTIGGLNREIVEQAIELGDAHKILYHLARDPAEAFRISNLSTGAKAAALAKLTMAPAKKTVSTAPSPVEPKVGSGTTTTDVLTSPNVSMDRWAAEREKQRAERRATRRR